MTEEIPTVTHEGQIKLSDDLEIKVFVLSNGERVIAEEDMAKALYFLGLSDLAYEIEQRIEAKKVP